MTSKMYFTQSLSGNFLYLRCFVQIPQKPNRTTFITWVYLFRAIVPPAAIFIFTAPAIGQIFIPLIYCKLQWSDSNGTKATMRLPTGRWDPEPCSPLLGSVIWGLWLVTLSCTRASKWSVVKRLRELSTDTHYSLALFHTDTHTNTHIQIMWLRNR